MWAQRERKYWARSTSCPPNITLALAHMTHICSLYVSWARLGKIRESFAHSQPRDVKWEQIWPHFLPDRSNLLANNPWPDRNSGQIFVNKLARSGWKWGSFDIKTDSCWPECNTWALVARSVYTGPSKESSFVCRMTSDDTFFSNCWRHIILRACSLQSWIS